MNHQEISHNHPHPLTYDHQTNPNSTQHVSVSSNTFLPDQEEEHHHPVFNSNSIINMNDNTIYDGYSILEQDVSPSIQNQNNVFSYVDIYPEPLINSENNTFIDNNDPELENVYVMLHSNIDNITNINDNNIDHDNNTNIYDNNDEDIHAEQFDLNNMNLPIPRLMRSHNMN